MEAVKNLLSPCESSASTCDTVQRYCDILNARRVESSDYNCDLCGNKGFIFRPVDGEPVAFPCKCKGPRDSIKRMKRSGLESTIRNCTFASFQVAEPWQRHMADVARDYVREPQGWFYIGGQVGCGKSHLCTAMVRELLLAGMEARYFPWRDGVARLKGQLNTEEYDQAMRDLKSVKVLYVDDLFKGGSADGRPSQADVNIAFELLNHRYLDRGLITILSSELTVEDLMRLDEAVGSRVYERSKGHYLAIDRDPAKNWRMKGASG